jgi:UDP-N-acetylglucosamine diphosphorylase / glucose-1-phosphate thymidylyltransferase / UDP-N-acetylgalactosamine diphosphorylase / glucosamine-1-phosphate N-acetyltransferase / galactosamine-1-phosphate N-acetyltransferase
METAILLAAGRGTKCLPFTETQPKAALPVVNQPNIAHLLEALRSAGIRRFAVVTGHLAPQVRHAVGSAPDVLLVPQPALPGTAPATVAALEALGVDEALVIPADLATPGENLARLAAAAPEAPAAALVVPLAPGVSPQSHLCARVEGDRVTAVLGHPRHGVTHRLTGAYVLRAPAVRALVLNPGLMTRVPVGGMPPLEGEIAETLAELAAVGQPVVAVEAGGFAIDIDRPWDLLAANRAWLGLMGAALHASRIDPTAQVSDGADIRGPVAVEAGARIGPGVIIEGPAWIGRNAVLEMGAHLCDHVAVGEGALVTEYAKVRPFTVVGPRCQVKHTAEVSGVLMENVCAHHHLDFVGIIGRSSDLGAGTITGTLRFDDGAQVMRVNGRPEAPGPWANCAYIGDFCRTGVGAIIMPGVRIGPYSCVGAGVVLGGDLPPGTAVFVKQELERRPWGPERYGW